MPFRVPASRSGGADQFHLHVAPKDADQVRTSVVSSIALKGIMAWIPEHTESLVWTEIISVHIGDQNIQTRVILNIDGKDVRLAVVYGPKLESNSLLRFVLDTAPQNNLPWPHMRECPIPLAITAQAVKQVSKDVGDRRTSDGRFNSFRCTSLSFPNDSLAEIDLFCGSLVTRGDMFIVCYDLATASETVRRLRQQACGFEWTDVVSLSYGIESENRVVRTSAKDFVLESLKCIGTLTIYYSYTDAHQAE
ncbi:hypothetical protein Slin15195_G071330 [Septoria linicola]|uniref:Uncharacterized protein n=1 Tax=Septoria linicola TaxID=215465 RepID=A0A9Q9ASG1_9PEZI|nr:hypothetical protein Slin15195_G071330 [Septoria linicola]